MEDNSSSDDEVQESSCSVKTGGKKLKLNDGSSQGSLKKSVATKKDENVDSGVSADKSESTSSDDRGAGTTEGPSNEVVNIAPSGSNIQAILLNIRRPRRGRNYRKRKTPDRDTDSNASSRDSDDLSVEETPQFPRLNDNSSSETESDNLERYMDLGSTESDGSSSGSSSSSDSNASYESDGLIRMHNVETDSDEERWTQRNQPEETEENKAKTPPVLLKERPKHNYIILREIMNREMGMTFPYGKTIKGDMIFGNRFYGSLHAIYRMKTLYHLNKHKGCVNSINFHPEGHLLVSGSDDTNIIIWDWARNAALQTIRTGHKSNVFQSKFLYLNAQSQLNIVTCARDGQVRLIQTPASGGAGSRRRLGAHSRAAHKLHVWPDEPHLIVSAGEDGLVMQCDVRADHPSRLFVVKERNAAVALYSVAGHPVDGRRLAVAGKDKFIRVYDRRRSPRPLAMYCPYTFQDTTTQTTTKTVRQALSHLTCAVYNHDGSEILASYNDEDIYLFDTKNDIYDKDSTEIKDGYTHRYSGHRNSATFKGVAYFGQNSEYVVSGSDCSHIYIWDKKTEAIVQWMYGDYSGVVNCIESHPRFPVLATSGLDKDVKIWMPRSHFDPTFDGMEKVIRENGSIQLRSPLFNDFLPTLYSAWRSENRLFTNDDNDRPPFSLNADFEENLCTTI